jgi:hypothetical protein
MLLVASGWPINATAAEMELMGLGASTCGQFASSYRKSPELVELNYFAWAQGYLSGLNMGSLVQGGLSKNIGGISTDEQQRIIRQYCNDHPLSNYNQAVTDLYFRFQNMSNPVNRQ